MSEIPTGGNPCPKFDEFGGRRAKNWGSPRQIPGVAAPILGVAELIMGVAALIMGVAELIGVAALILGVATLILPPWTHPPHSTRFLSSLINKLTSNADFYLFISVFN